MPDTTIQRLRLVGDINVQRDVVAICKTLLEGAENGEIVGIVFAAVLQRQLFVTDVAGTCKRHLTHARGMVQSLDDMLRMLGQDRDPEEER